MVRLDILALKGSTAFRPIELPVGRSRAGSERILALDQPQTLEAYMTIPAHNDVVVHRNAERLRHLDDLLRRIDVGARRRGIARRMVVHETIV